MGASPPCGLPFDAAVHRLALDALGLIRVLAGAVNFCLFERPGFAPFVHSGLARTPSRSIVHGRGVHTSADQGRAGSLSHTQAKRACEPRRSGCRCARPVALNHCIEADVAAGAGRNPRPQGKFAGAARTSGACHWSTEKRSKQRSQQPKVEQNGCEHPETLKHADRVFGVHPDKRGGQNNHQEPAQMASNAHLQLEVFHHAHDLIVLGRTFIRSLSHLGDMWVFPCARHVRLRARPMTLLCATLSWDVPVRKTSSPLPDSPLSDPGPPNRPSPPNESQDSC